jgi:hypothetical protein
LETKALIEQRQEEQKLIRRKVQQLRERRKGRPATQRQDAEDTQMEKTKTAMTEHAEPRDDPRARLLNRLSEVL